MSFHQNLETNLPPMRILYVDDDPMVCRAFKRVASSLGFEVTCVTSPYKAIPHIKEGGIHILAVDYNMPEVNGVEFLEMLGKKGNDFYKLMVTGMCNFETIHAAINRAGVNRYITKPWQLQDLLSVLREAGEHVRLRLENQELQERLRKRNTELAAINRALDAVARERTLDVLNALVSALDYRDTETQWHSRRVALFARMIGSQLNLDSEVLKDVELGALLHDIGKIGISDTILLKPGKLTEEEWVEMRKHPQIGYEMLKGIDFLSDARLTVLHHHERWDGGGYPNQLKNTEICLGARIFALCDTLDAITSDRPYRKARTLEFAYEEILRCAGTQFDPAICRIFQEVGYERWKKAITIGHIYDKEKEEDINLGELIAQSLDVLPELGEAFAWQSVAHRGRPGA